MNEKVEEQNKMDQVLKELGDLYEFNRKIQEFNFVRKDEATQIIEEDFSNYERDRGDCGGSD